jgi:hypothetical protein
MWLDRGRKSRQGRQRYVGWRDFWRAVEVGSGRGLWSSEPAGRQRYGVSALGVLLWNRLLGGGARLFLRCWFLLLGRWLVLGGFDGGLLLALG